MNETAALNDKFRKTVPTALVIYPKGIEMRSPLFGVSHQIIHAILDFEFPATDRSDRNWGGLKLRGAVSGVVVWVVRPTQDDETNALRDDYFPITTATDLLGDRRRAGMPHFLDELMDMYERYTLVIYMPGSPLPAHLKEKV